MNGLSCTLLLPFFCVLGHFEGKTEKPLFGPFSLFTSPSLSRRLSLLAGCSVLCIPRSVPSPVFRPIVKSCRHHVFPCLESFLSAHFLSSLAVPPYS